MGTNNTHPSPYSIEFCHFEELVSTHTFVLQKNWLDRMQENKIYAIFAETQTKGVGSHNRTWLTTGKDFHLNLVFLADKIYPFSQMAALTACQFLGNFTQHKQSFYIKWPNDVCVNNCKIGGCLSHVRNWDKGFWVTIGVGINFNLTQSSCQKIDQPSTSLRILLHNTDPYPANELFAAVQDYSKVFAQNLHWYKQQSNEQFFKDCAPYWALLGEKIELYDEDRKQWCCGILDTIDLNGRLVLKNDSGTICILNGTKLRQIQ